MILCCEKEERSKDYAMSCSRNMYNAITGIVDNSVKKPSSVKRSAKVPAKGLLPPSKRISHVLPTCVI